MMSPAIPPNTAAAGSITRVIIMLACGATLL